MTLYYSALAGGFFDDDLHPMLPGDARPITRETWAALMEAQAEGKRIIADAAGDPIAADPAPRTAEQEMLYLRSRRDRLLRLSDRTQVPDFPISADDRAAWAVYRAQLRDLPESCAADPWGAVWPVAPTEGIT